MLAATHSRKRCFTLICAALFAGTAIKAQSSQSMTFSCGSSVPVGHFSRSKSIADRGAEDGNMIEIGYYAHKKGSAFGFVASARFMMTSLRRSYPVSVFSGTPGQPGFETNNGTPPIYTKGEVHINDPNNYPGYSTKIHEAYLEAGAYLAGITHTLQFSRRWSLQEELQIGIARVTLDRSTLKGTRADTANAGSVDVVYSEWENSPARAVTGIIKIAPAFRLNKSVAFFLSADYWYIRSKMTYASATSYGVVPRGTDQSSLQLNNGYVNAFQTFTQASVMKNPTMINVQFGIRVAVGQ